MPFNGSGTFTRNFPAGGWRGDAAQGIKVRADRHDQHDEDIATGLSNVICRDGQSTVTADISFGGRKITNLGTPTLATDAATKAYADSVLATPFSILNIMAGGVIDFGSGDLTITHSTDTITIASTDEGGTASTPSFILDRFSTTPAALDWLGSILFQGRDSVGGVNNYASIYTRIIDATSTSEDGSLQFWVMTAGGEVEGFRTQGNAVYPGSTDNARSLGIPGSSWSDLYLGSGAVIDFGNGDVTLTHSTDTLTLTAANDTNVEGVPALVLHRHTATPASFDGLGHILFTGLDAASNVTSYGRFSVVIGDATEGTEDGWLFVDLMRGGTLTNILIITDTAMTCSVTNRLSLGSAGTQWADLFLASGGVINFSAGDVTITHSSTSSGLLLFEGALGGYIFDSHIFCATSGGGQLGAGGGEFSSLFLATGGVINFAAADVTITHSANTLAFAGATTGYTFGGGPVYPAVNGAISLGISGAAWSDLFLATGAVINFGAGNITLTHSAETLTMSGFNTELVLASTNDTATALPRLTLHRNSATPAVNDQIGVIAFDGEDSASVQTIYAQIGGKIVDPTNTAETGMLMFGVRTTGTYDWRLEMTGTVLGPAGNDFLALGKSGTAFSDLFLATGGVINFGAGNALITHSAGVLTFTGKVTTEASVAGAAKFNLPHGAAPSAPVNGDMWTTTAGLYIRVNGVTVGPLT